MSARGVKALAAWIAGAALAVGIMGCRASVAPRTQPADAGSEAPSLLLTEITVRALGPDVLARVQANDAQHTAVQVDWSNEVPAIQVRQDRNDLVRIVLNPAFWREHERMIEATVFATYLDVRKESRAFAIARAQALRDNRHFASRPVAETLWEEIGLSPARFAHLRERLDFQSRVRALRHQALAWSLARATARDLAGTADLRRADIDRRAAETTFDLHGLPAPPLVTAFLTAAVESLDPRPSPSVLLCRAADWVALGAQVIETDASFQQRLAHSEDLQRTVATMLKGLDRLREEGQCAMTL